MDLPSEENVFSYLSCNSENVFYVGNATCRSMINSIVSGYDLDNVLSFLEHNKVDKLCSICGDLFYAAFGHTDLKADLENIADFKPIYKYHSDCKPVNTFEVGSFNGIRFFLTPGYSSYLMEGGLSNVLVSNRGKPCLFDDFAKNGYKPLPEMQRCDVYPIIFLGNKSYGFINTWSLFITVIHNQDNIAVLETGCSAFPGVDEFYK